MELFEYAATLKEVEPGDFIVRISDIPEAIAGGETAGSALASARGALEAAVEHYLELNRTVPAPRAVKRSEHSVPLDPELAARVALRDKMSELGVSNVALAKRMHRDEKAVRRILSGKNSSFGMAVDALRTLGFEPVLSLRRVEAVAEEESRSHVAKAEVMHPRIVGA